MFNILNRDGTVVDVASTAHEAQGVVDWLTIHEIADAPYRFVEIGVQA